jgi:hypothetical protein
MPPKGSGIRGRNRRGRGSDHSSERGSISREPIPRDSTESQGENPQPESSSSSSGKDLSCDNSGSNPDITPITVGGQQYYKAEDLAGYRKGKKRSYIWQHGYEIIHAEKKTKHYYCKLCLDENQDKSYTPLVINGTSSVLAHFRTKHNSEEGENSSGIGTASLAPSELISTEILGNFKSLLMKWIVSSHISFAQFDNIYFLNLISAVSPLLAKCLPSRDTFRRWFLTEFEKGKQKVMEDLKTARSNIHLSFHLWRSPDFDPIIAIAAHYIDAKGRRQTKLLAVRQLRGEHSGENIAEIVLEVIEEYKIRKQIGFFISDNRSSNDVAVDVILSELFEDMNETSRKRRRLRCLAHVTNLVAKASLLGPKVDETAAELFLAQRYERDDPERETRLWQKHGALGKLHNFVSHVQGTPKRRQDFKRCYVDSHSWKEFNRLEVSPFFCPVEDLLS